VNNGVLTQFVTNAGEARVKGLELEVTALPWSGMELTASLGLLDSHYVQGTFLDSRRVGTTIVTFDRSDEPIPQAPEVSYGFGATQQIMLPFGELSLHADYYHVSERVFFADTAAPGQTAAQIAQIAIGNQLGKLSGYGVANAKVDLDIADTGFKVSACIRNLTDERYLTNLNSFYTSLGGANAYAAPPRTYGASVTYRW
jgi:iron complex outermembrane recepter protein